MALVLFMAFGFHDSLNRIAPGIAPDRITARSDGSLIVVMVVGVDEASGVGIKHSGREEPSGQGIQEVAPGCV